MLVSLLLLALPWAGCQFVREIEGTMRQGQVQSLQATTQAIAAALRDQPTLLYPDPRRSSTLPAKDGSIYARESTAPIIVDGYADGWEPRYNTRLRASIDETEFAVQYQAHTRDSRLYLLFQVEDPSVIFHNPGISREANGDRLILQTWLANKRQQYVIASAAPGVVRAQFGGRRHPGINPARIHGVWQDAANGYTLELEMPLSLIGERLGFFIINASSGSGKILGTVGNIDALRTAAPPWLIHSPALLPEVLQPFAQLGGTVTVFDRGNWQLAEAQPNLEDANPIDGDQQETFWLLKLLYRSILAEEPLPALPPTDDTGQRQSVEISAALAGRAESRWYGSQSGGARATLSSAAPIIDQNIVIGAVVVQQNSEQYLSLTDRAFSRLLGYSFLALVIASMGLLGYATVLSWRIKQLSIAAANVVQRDRSVGKNFPRSQAKDEIGELSRRYADLLTELGEYNEYLRTLSSKLSHELRTPIAVIQSSLDNLEQSQDSAGEREIYVQRAREGLSRLAGILTAMSESSRVEESIYSSNNTAIDLQPLLNELQAAYAAVYPTFDIRLDCSVSIAETYGSADLLVQALDKLLENAASFSKPGGVITLGLNESEREKAWLISVTNTGSSLPEDMKNRLFEPMVSVRSSASTEQVHLGLGLHIVSLICASFNGSVFAENLADSQGVRFSLGLPKHPRE